jgi:hypothetical protein
MRKTPKVFISYSCTNEKRAIDIACRLIKNGVEVVVDKWDLKPGHDKFQFMERSVTDPTIDKVLLLCDRTYKEKADSRAGGVGDETTIISSKIYGEATQEKFLAVALEFDENGAPFLPAYMSSRIYIDFGDKKGSGKQFEDLLRAIYDRPKHSRPATGSEPDFLDQDEDCVSGESGYKTPTLLNNKSLQQNCVNKFHYHKDNSDAVKKLASLLQLLHPKVPHYPPALFTCFFFDALTNWEYHYNDDIFKSGYDTGNIDFQNLMENIYNGESELPAYLRAHIENSLQKTEMDSISEFIAFCCGDIDCCAVNNLTGNATGDSIADKVVQYIHIICASYHQPEQPVSNFPKGIPYASLTYEPWIQFSENTNRTSPDTQSRFNYLVRAAALCGRFDELNCLIEFCNSDVAGEPFLWFAVSGLGGSGKSRIAKELYEWIEYINSGQWKLFWIDIANAAEVDIDEKMDKVIAATKPNQQVLVVLDSNKLYL